MKRYKLLKDTPAIKAGAIFEEQGNFDDDKELVQVVSDGCLTKPWFAVSDIDNFDEWFEEIHKEHKRWRGKHNERYWCVDGRGGVYCSTEDGHSVDDYRFDTGSYFKTEEEAEAYKEYIIARQVILDDAEGGGDMADADLVLFCPNWQEARGCVIEHEIAKAYHKPVKYLQGWE